jgi:hypothetical protein
LSYRQSTNSNNRSDSKVETDTKAEKDVHDTDTKPEKLENSKKRARDDDTEAEGAPAKRVDSKEEVSNAAS